MSDKSLNEQSDIEELSAWMDGELSGPQAERVARLVETDPRWRADFERFGAVAAAMDLLAPAELRRDLSDRIVRSARRRRRLVIVAREAVGLAAAACIVLALWLGGRPSGPPTAGQPAAAGVEARIVAILKDIPPKDRFIVRNLPLFRNYDEVAGYQQVRDLADAETLSALAAIDSEEM